MKKTNSALRAFLMTACVLALAVGGGASLLAAAGILAETGIYRVYLLYYFSVVFGGAALVSLTVFLWDRVSAKNLKKKEADLKELEKTVAGLREMAERQEEFIGSFAHELKTPLTAIIGYADMLRSKDMAPKPRFTAAGYIFSEGKRLEALSLKLLDIIVLDNQGLQTRRYDAGLLLREVAAVTMPAADKDGLTLHLSSEKGEIWIDPDLFKTLLVNLVDNARKASKRGQSIELIGCTEPEGYAFYIRDHGRGMRQQELSKITEPFYMIDKSRARAQNGAGLGLALCKKIAQLHGTRLEYTSAPGEGTTVRVFLKGGGSNGEEG